MSLPVQPDPNLPARGFALPRRVAGLAVIAAVLALVVIGATWGGGPTYVTLFRNLEISSVGAITDGLTKGGIPYKLDGGGTEVLVRPDDAAKARVLLAKDGLPASGKPGLELFDKPTWGMTDFTQRVTYRRALEGELSRTIGSLRGVDHAQVHLALPEASPLRRLERPAQAAVVLSLKGGVSLSPDVVQGIAYIVANSVEQLPSENVAVMDDSGRLLSAPTDAGNIVGLTTRQLDLQHAVEKQLQQKAEEMLATVVGVGRARVQVAAQLNFDQAERTIEAYDPDKQVLQTEQKSETQADTLAGTGAQTVVSNQYQNSKTIERVIGSVGTVKKLTVAVLVDDSAIGREATKVGATQQGQLALLEGAVRNAIGIDSVRGDRITVTAMPFEPTAVPNVKALVGDSGKSGGGDTMVIVERFSRPGLILAGLIVALVLGLKLMKPAAPAPGAPAIRGGSRDDGAGSETPSLTTHAPMAPMLERPRNTASLQLRQTVQAESSNEPETVAQVIRAWLAER